MSYSVRTPQHVHRRGWIDLFKRRGAALGLHGVGQQLCERGRRDGPATLDEHGVRRVAALLVEGRGVGGNQRRGAARRLRVVQSLDSHHGQREFGAEDDILRREPPRQAHHGIHRFLSAPDDPHVGQPGEFARRRLIVSVGVHHDHGIDQRLTGDRLSLAVRVTDIGESLQQVRQQSGRLVRHLHQVHVLAQKRLQQREHRQDRDIAGDPMDRQAPG